MDELEALVEQVPDEVLDYIDALEDRVEKAEGYIASLQEDEDDNLSPVEKALAQLPTEVAKMFRDQGEELRKAQEAIQAQSVAKADADWTAKVRPFDGLIDSPDTFGPQLRQVAEINGDLADNIVSALEAANARVAKAALFEEIGHNQVAKAGSAQAQVEQLAKSLREVKPDMTEAMAISEVLEAHPDLYETYTAERREAQRA